jgi:hypothetical protein
LRRAVFVADTEAKAQKKYSEYESDLDESRMRWWNPKRCVRLAKSSGRRKHLPRR